MEINPQKPKRNARKTLLSFGFVTVSLVILLAWLLHSVGQEVEAKMAEPKAFVGRHFILEGDTAMVLDYSNLSRTYHLSNDRDVSFGLLPKLKEVK